MEEPDFIPKDDKLCENCIYRTFCPEDWLCETSKRWYEYYCWFEGDIDVRDGDSTEKVR